MIKVRARVHKTDKFMDVTFRRNNIHNVKMRNTPSGKTLYCPTSAYTHVGRDTVSGQVYEAREYGGWVFKPTGKNAKLL